MNSSVYIFGNLSSGYKQYPYEETTSLIFREFYTKAKATTQIAIRRDGNLMYYAYIRQLEQGKYIGFCVLLNGVALTRFERIFSLFENVHETIHEGDEAHQIFFVRHVPRTVPVGV